MNSYLKTLTVLELFHDGDPYAIDTSWVISIENQQSSFYMIETSVIKRFKKLKIIFMIIWKVIIARRYDILKIMFSIQYKKSPGT